MKIFASAARAGRQPAALRVSHQLLPAAAGVMMPALLKSQKLPAFLGRRLGHTIFAAGLIAMRHTCQEIRAF